MSVEMIRDWNLVVFERRGDEAYPKLRSIGLRGSTGWECRTIG
jgi:hypothetical protein